MQAILDETVLVIGHLDAFNNSGDTGRRLRDRVALRVSGPRTETTWSRASEFLRHAERPRAARRASRSLLAREAAAAPCPLGAAANGAWRHRFRKYCLTAERSGLPMPGTAPSSTVQMIAPPSP